MKQQTQLDEFTSPLEEKSVDSYPCCLYSR